jgi:hypothetical protein
MADLQSASVRTNCVAELSILQDDRTELRHGVSFRAAFWVWLRVAMLSFGGPAGQIAVMHRILVEEKRWISESRFLHALNYCVLLPGPEAQQLATYVGWLMHRTAGGIISGGLFIVPGIISIMALISMLATHVPLIAALFFGLKVAVCHRAGGRLPHRQALAQEQRDDPDCRGSVRRHFLRHSVSGNHFGAALVGFGGVKRDFRVPRRH